MILHTNRSRLIPTRSCILLLSSSLAFASAACGGDQSQAQYPENSHHEEEAPDPFQMPESSDGSEDMQEAPEMEMDDASEAMEGQSDAGAMHGQPGAPAPVGSLDSSPPPRVSSDEVEAFSACVLKLTELQKGLEQRARAGETPEQLNREFQAQARSILEDEGLSPRRYEEIAQLVTQDPRLRERVRQALEDEAKS